MVANHGDRRRVTRAMAAQKSGSPTKSPIVKRRRGPASAVRVPISNQGPLSTHRIPPIHAARYGLIQERTAHDLYSLLIAAMLWNRTKGSSARPVLEAILYSYPSPEELAQARESDLVPYFAKIGLQNQRAKRFLAFAQAWVDSPPQKGRRFRTLHYPDKGDGLDVGKDEVLDEEDPRQGWEIGHLPGIGPYALDSFRIFYRDVLRGLATDWQGTGAPAEFEPEWKRVLPTDKELKPYLRWMWLKEGWLWDSVTGKRRKATSDQMKGERMRLRSVSPDNRV